MQLNDIQRRFKETILAHPDVVANPPEDLYEIFKSDDIELSERLKIYRNNVIGSLSDVMLANFPGVEKLVGYDFFMGMARSFILAHPPKQACLAFYGTEFPSFIESFAPAKGLPYLADVARLESALNDAYYAADDTPLGDHELAAIAAEKLGDLLLQTRDCVKLIESPYPIHDIRDFALDDNPNGELDLDKGGAFLMVYRPKLDTEIIILDNAEYTLLAMLISGKPLGSSVEEVINKYPDFNFQDFIQKHIFLETFLTLNPNA